MDCETCREALSARLDGEEEPVPAADVDAHLSGCPACRAWSDEASALTRVLRLRPAVAVPDLTEAVLAAAPPPTTGWYPRLGLAGVAVAQVTLGLSQLLGPNPAASHGAGHLFNESTAWNLALGLGLLWTALRPRATSGMVPVVAGFVVVVGVYSFQDLAVGVVSVERVTSHAILLLGLVLLVLVHRGRRDPDDGHTARPLDRPDLPDSTDFPDRRPDSAPSRRPRLRPVGRDRAA
ncbi:zf-HC2 domain-containing protein [Saccharothrix sp.]|uniref:zf-HC2 domain-containing protein n=1 Tax=Saccharothrix sp. TaxID=1873460 RepID=UPI002811AFA7|nr:zf-HC2 domain-containing protein [Saccharothrix sp.]